MSGLDLLGQLQARADAAAPVTLILADRLLVAFHGQRGGDGPVTVGQASTLAWVTDRTAYTRMLEWPLSLPTGTTLADITAALEVLLARHESLRTWYPPGDPPCQRVAGSGELLVDVYEASDEPTDPAVLTAGLVRLLRASEFDVTAELPVRVAVACWQGVPAAAVILYSHMAVDFTSMALIDRQFFTLAAEMPVAAPSR